MAQDPAGSRIWNWWKGKQPIELSSILFSHNCSPRVLPLHAIQAMTESVTVLILFMVYIRASRNPTHRNTNASSSTWNRFLNRYWFISIAGKPMTKENKEMKPPMMPRMSTKVVAGVTVTRLKSLDIWKNMLASWKTGTGFSGPTVPSS